MFVDPIRTMALPFNSYFQINRQSQAYEVSNKVQAVVLLLTLFQAFKFAAMSKKVNLMWLTVHKALGYLGVFLLFFTTIFIAYVIAGHHIFGGETYEFSTFALSFRTLLLALLGELNYNKLQDVNRYLAPLFVISYLAIMGMGLLNIFLAILTHSYNRLRMLYFDTSGISGVEKRPSSADGALVVTPWQALVALMPVCLDIRGYFRRWWRGADNSYEM